jgi:hypothetical protein
LEDGIALVKRILGANYLERILIHDSTPVHVLDDETNPLRKWLFSALVDRHIIQVMELASYLREFQADPALPDKVYKLINDNFWPTFFELAMAARVKRSCRGTQTVRLNHEDSKSIGDFTIHAAKYKIPCECARLGRSPQITDSPALLESLTNRISDGAKKSPVPLCVKIRSTEPLVGRTYNIVLRLVRKALADVRNSRLPSEQEDGPTSVLFERLTGTSEQIPFRNVDGRLVAVRDTDWDSAQRICWVSARHRDDVTERFIRGERFHEYEAVRLFTRFGAHRIKQNDFGRLTAKLKKKLNQTKTTAEHFGKVVFVELPFDLRASDPVKLRAAIREAATQSRTTLAVILARREQNPHFRYHYSQTTAFNRTAAIIHSEPIELFARASKGELAIDPILGAPYSRSWGDAREHAAKVTGPIPE